MLISLMSRLTAHATCSPGLCPQLISAEQLCKVPISLPVPNPTYAHITSLGLPWHMRALSGQFSAVLARSAEFTTALLCLRKASLQQL